MRFHRLTLTAACLGLAFIAVPPSEAGQAKPRTQVSPAPTHPLDPLTASEINSVVNILRARTEMVPANAFFPQIALNEPPKAEVRAFKPGSSFRRSPSIRRSARSCGVR